jgi:hypothetical protein
LFGGEVLLQARRRRRVLLAVAQEGAANNSGFSIRNPNSAIRI